MTDPNYSHLIFIVDRSGSMEDTAEDATGGIHQTLRDLIIQSGRKTFSLYQFDTEHERMFHFAPLAKGMTYALKPRGGTSLFDAIMEGTTREGESLAAMEEDMRPGKVVLAIVTDGQENSSVEYSRWKGGLEKVKARLEEQQTKYSWQVTFIGANMDAIAAGADMGVAMASSLTFNQSHVGTRNAYKSFSGATSRYLSGLESSLSYTEAERDSSLLDDD